MQLSKEIETQIQLLLSQGKRIEAIKLVHTVAQCDLKEAINFIDHFTIGLPKGPVHEPPVNINAQLLSLLSQEKKIEAIKLYKDLYHAGLAESKEYIENLEEQGIPTAPPSRNSSPELHTRAERRELKGSILALPPKLWWVLAWIIIATVFSVLFIAVL